MDGLPCEILEHVYCFLNFCDYLRATEVCCLWKNIFASKISRNGNLIISYHMLKARNKSLYTIFELFSKNSRIYQNIVFEGIDFLSFDRKTEIQFKVFLANVGWNSKFLILQDCILTTFELCQICKLMKELEFLEISSCRIHYNVMLVPDLKLNFTTLKLINIRNLKTENEEIIDLLTEGNSAVIELIINDSYIDDRTKIMLSMKRLKRLSCTFYQSVSVQNILSRPEVVLHSLQLQRKPSDLLHPDIISNIIQNQCNLREFCINTPLTAELLTEISRNLVYLEKLSITIHDSISPVCSTTTWPNLRVLQMSCRTMHFIDVILNSMIFEKLTELQLYTERFSKNTMKIIYAKCSGLKTLTLSALSMMRCQETLGTIGCKLLNIETIDIHCSSQTDFAAFLKSAETLRHLRSLHLFYCEKITDHTIASICMPYLSSFKLSHNRQKLRMDNCRRILVQWRFAPQYINNVQCLRLYHDTYPEFFYYNLPTVNSEPPKSNNYIYFDSNDDSSDLDELHF
ncbi:uncharacterized protein LOC129732735 isoform X2 [Wyeomyia smithii]|uniref:uncharacterized protein LOC129732735 isoform X2 n=1 Tax=Wyeomyia smithii TaxID=174621 RepID=UPI0024680AD1|nr:uncharacterized protein LOC129732735 isoform X2 [Wyeomyia smithii]